MMKLLALKAYGTGYRGCLIAEGEYRFFQYTPRRGFRLLKTYPQDTFEDDLHFIAMMQKFMSPSAFIVPPVPIARLDADELRRVDQERKNKKAGKDGGG